jgi:Tol biopolymer transport system component
VRLQRPAIVRVVNLATCRERTIRSPARRPSTPGVSVSRHAIAYRGRVVVSVPRATGPIVFRDLSPDRRWILFAIDPYGSASLAADGLFTRIVSVAGGKPHRLGTMLGYDDYHAWCGGKLVFVLGGDREATVDKQLAVAAPPDWKPHGLTTLKGRAWGSIACSPDGRSVVVQSQPAEELRSFFSTRWQLWRVELDGRATRLTSPPPQFADESPRFGPGGRLFFVRSRRGIGRLYALEAGGRLVGPLVSLGYSLGYYGADAWSYAVTR